MSRGVSSLSFSSCALAFPSLLGVGWFCSYWPHNGARAFCLFGPAAVAVAGWIGLVFRRFVAFGGTIVADIFACRQSVTGGWVFWKPRIYSCACPRLVWREKKNVFLLCFSRDEVRFGFNPSTSHIHPPPQHSGLGSIAL